MEKGAEPWGGRSRAAAGGGPKSGGSPSEGPYSEPESGGADSGDEHDVGMRVGAEYQARIPDFEPGATKYTDKDNGGMLVWSPYHNIPDAKLDEYIAIAKEKHGYNVEQARQQTLQLNGSAYSCGLDSLQKIELFVFMTCSACNVHF